MGAVGVVVARFCTSVADTDDCEVGVLVVAILLLSLPLQIIPDVLAGDMKIVCRLVLRVERLQEGVDTMTHAEMWFKSFTCQNIQLVKIDVKRSAVALEVST